MCRTQIVLGLVAWYVGVAQCWDFAVSFGDQLIFYNSDGNKTDTVHFESHNVNGLAFDDVHNRMLYVDKQSNNDAICGYYISSKENKCFMERSGRNIQSIAYDPATEKIFFTDTDEKSINWLSLKRGSNNNVYGLIKTDTTPTDIAVDSCTGNIFWCNGYVIETANFNGNGRIFLYSSPNCFSLAIDQQTPEKIYYIDSPMYTSYPIHFTSGSLDGNNEFVLTELKASGKDMTKSKDYFYWLNIEARYGTNGTYDFVWQYSIHEHLKDPKEIIKFYTEKPLGIAANYKIEDQINGIYGCHALSSLLPITAAPATTQRSEASVCENYCLGGTCSVNDERHPKCSCEAGYLGERCEVNFCHNYCLNDGVCSLNEEDEPACQCVGNHEGPRCEADRNDTSPALDLTKRNLTLADLFSTWRKPLSKMYLTVEV